MEGEGEAFDEVGEGDCLGSDETCFEGEDEASEVGEDGGEGMLVLGFWF